MPLRDSSTRNPQNLPVCSYLPFPSIPQSHFHTFPHFRSVLENSTRNASTMSVKMYARGVKTGSGTGSKAGVIRAQVCSHGVEVCGCYGDSLFLSGSH